MIRTRPTRAAAVATAGLAAALALLTGCSSSVPTALSAPPPAGGAGKATAAAPGGGAPQGGATSTASIRIVNLFGPKGSPGPALDVYDVPLHGSAATPILANVAYGTASAYAHPHVLTSVGQKVIELEVMPAGESPTTQSSDATAIGGLIDDGSGAQITFRLNADTDAIGQGPLAGMSISQFVEKGDDGQGGTGPVAPAPDAGTAQLLADDSLVPADGHTSVYLMIDGSCAPPANGDPNVKGVPEIFAADGVAPESAFAVFPTAPGTHQISVVPWGTGTPPTCAQLTAKQAATSVDVQAGQQVLLFVYGPDFDHLGIAQAPVQ